MAIQHKAAVFGRQANLSFPPGGTDHISASRQMTSADKGVSPRRSVWPTNGSFRSDWRTEDDLEICPGMEQKMSGKRSGVPVSDNKKDRNVSCP
jgi:hypothetical protein